MGKIFIADDEKNIRDLLGKFLEDAGHEVRLFENGDSLLTELDNSVPDIVVLDVMMPGMNGLEMCRKIRESSNIPVIMLSAKSEDLDKIVGLTGGADDYVTKPFDNNVFLAKVQGLLRRSYEFGTDQSLLEYQGVILNLKSMDLVYEGELVTLTKNEFQILRVLFEHSGSIVARDDLMKELWNSDFFIDDNTLSVNVARLRKKLEEHGLKHFIETKKGIGYGLTNGHAG